MVGKWVVLLGHRFIVYATGRLKFCCFLQIKIIKEVLQLRLYLFNNKTQKTKKTQFINKKSFALSVMCIDKYLLNKILRYTY